MKRRGDGRCRNMAGFHETWEGEKSLNQEMKIDMGVMTEQKLAKTKLNLFFEGNGKPG